MGFRVLRGFMEIPAYGVLRLRSLQGQYKADLLVRTVRPRSVCHTPFRRPVPCSVLFFLAASSSQQSRCLQPLRTYLQERGAEASLKRPCSLRDRGTQTLPLRRWHPSREFSWGLVADFTASFRV